MVQQTILGKSVFGKTADFLGKVKSELKKVTWPTRKETFSSTQVVIILTLILALYFWLVDSGLSAMIQLMLR
jgi:preprotein translocase subunit SecE